jgi:hypothetical protein
VSRKKPKTAIEFSAELERDPEYQAARTRIQRDAEAQGKAAAQDERSLIADLERAGITIQSVYDLVNDKVTPVEAVPQLLRHLEVPHTAIVREGILRALAYSHLRADALDFLKQFFTRSQVPYERWLTANALATMAPLAELRTSVPGIEEFAELFRRTPRQG